MELVKSFGRRPGAGLEYEYTAIKNRNNFILFLNKEARKVIKKQFSRTLRYSSWKIWVDVKVEFQKIETTIAHGGQPAVDKTAPATDLLYTIKVIPWFRCDESHIVLNGKHSLDEALDDCFNELQNRFDVFVFKGSGLQFVEVQALRLIAAKYVPLSGGSIRDNMVYLKMPSNIRKNVVRIIADTNSSAQCFLDAVRVGCTLQRKSRVKMPYAYNIMETNTISQNQFDTRSLTFPTSIKQIRAFEKQNPSLYINVFGWKNCKRPPKLEILYHSKESEQGKVVLDLLLYRSHFFLIRSLSQLLGQKNIRHVCRSCLLLFATRKAYDNHKLRCDNSGTTYKMPQGEDAIVKFRKKESLMLGHFQFYMDIETHTKPEIQVTAKGKQKMVHRHESLAVGAIRICTTNPIHNSDLFLSVGENSIENFLHWLDEQSAEIDIILQEKSLPIHMTRDDWEHHLRQGKCEMCGIKFDSHSLKMKDHDHLSGKYRAALCNDCNLRICRKMPKDLCITSHNWGKFDSSLAIRSMAKRARQEKARFRVIQKSRNNNLVIFYKQWKFFDSLNFLSSSLSNLMTIRLSDEKPNGPPVFPLILEHVGGDREKYNLLCRKQVYPFSTLTGLDALQRTELPSTQEFYDPLKKQAISEEDYNHAKNVWNTFGCTTMKDYLIDVYLCVDVLALASIFEDFRCSQHASLGLDPAGYFSLPHYSFHCMLKYTGVEIELIKDQEIYTWMRSAIRGGNTFVCRRYAASNLPEHPGYDATKPRSEIRYFDTKGECRRLQYSSVNCTPPRDVQKMFSLDHYITLHRNHLWISFLQINHLRIFPQVYILTPYSNHYRYADLNG